MADEPSWDDIFRPAGAEPTRPQQPAASPEQTSGAYPGVRSSDPFALAAAEATAQTRLPARESEAPTRRQLREQEEQTPRRRGRPSDELREKKPAKKRRGLIAALVVLVLVVASGGAAALYVWTNYEEQVREALGWQLPNDYPGSGNGQEIIVTVSQNDIGADVARNLHEAEVTMSFDAVYDLLLEREADGDPVVFFPGSFRLQGEMSAASAIAAVTDPANQLVNRVLITEGMSYEGALEQMAAASGIPLEEFQAAADDYTSFGVPADAPNIEGWMFPATYDFGPDATARDMIQMTVDEMIERLDALGVAPENRLNILKMAALVQRESGPNVEDMYKIARVFTNRIEQGMLLQSDATVAYGTGNTHTVWTTEEERQDPNNLYSTYFHPGLPYGPIGLPGEDAIKAAITPADGPWLYFVPINLQTGETVFSETADEHQAAAERLYAWCRESDENASYCA